jgi:hypothetical protein
MKRFLKSAVMILGAPGAALADWTPLITSDSFTGIQTDVQTAAVGIMAVVLVILGVAVLMRVFAH